MLTLYFKETDAGPVHRVQEAGMEVLSPLQAATSRIVKPFRDAWNWFGDLFSAQSQNKRLRKENAELRQALARQMAVERENERLRDLLAITDNEIYPDGSRMVAARVIGRSTEAWYSTITVSAGGDEGVALYDTVVNEQGLVGRVTAVTSDAAQVTLVTDQKSAVGAEILPGGARGVVAGSVTGDVRMRFVDKSEKVEKGQLIVTSGVAGSVFARDILIGVVEDVGQQDVETYQTISVKPVVDFRKLDWVMVVVDQ